VGLVKLGFLSSQLSRTGEWFLHSGVQQPNGGVSRYYRVDSGFLPVSTEITGYAVSFFVYLHSVLGDKRYLEAAERGAGFLVSAWDPKLCVMPFEVDPPRHSYFFDCGIIVRGLLSAWRAIGEERFRTVAVAVGNAMLRDFANEHGDFHPILELPAKIPVERDAMRWSRSAGCYQLKSAMAWWDLFEATGENCFQVPYKRVLEYSLETYRQFIPGKFEKAQIMDRLHAYSYFLEGLLPWANQERCKDALFMGLAIGGGFLHAGPPQFVRSDVYAQILRARLFADWAGAVGLDGVKADAEAEALATFQREDGGWWFGRKDGEMMPFVNPVSAAFGSQALDLWERREQINRHLLV
jgi:hypothetical protein